MEFVLKPKVFSIVRVAIFTAVISGILFFALTSFAATANPDFAEGTGIAGGICDNGVDCTWQDFVILVRRIISFFVLVSIPLAALLFAYAGFLYITAGGNSGQISSATKIFWSVLWGIVVMLSAWLIVNLIVSALIKDNLLQGIVNFGS